MPAEELRLIVGLGNPGRRYHANRHNIGFMVAEELARRLGLGFSRAGINYVAAGDPRHSETPVLLKPLTYMNLSGEAVLRWADDHGVDLMTEPVPKEHTPAVDETDAADVPAAPIEPSEQGSGLRPLVVCDDLALPLGAVRLRPRGSSGGQNGLLSIIDGLGSEDFPRLRLGIAPAEQTLPSDLWPDYVTSDFEPEEAEVVTEVISHACDALEFWLDSDVEQTASRYNRRGRSQT